LDQLAVGPGVPLTDAQWARIEPLLPDRTPKRGGRWRDHREVIDAIAFKFQTGTQWVHLPEKYGNWRGVYDAPAFTDVMARLRVPRPSGRPRTRPDLVLADKAYSSRAIRNHLRRPGIRTVIPERADQPPFFDREAYKQRNTVERCINRLKQWRGIATRYEKTATIYLAGLHIAGIFLWSAR
jgi:transposase